MIQLQQVLDNRSRGSVGEFLKAEIKKNAKMSIVSAYFTIFAYGELKVEERQRENALYGALSSMR